MKFLINILFFVLFLFIYSEASPSYSILAPQIIRPRSKYNVIVAFHEITQDTTLTCTLTKANNDSATAITQTDRFNRQNNFKVIELEIGTQFTQGLYNLNITSSGEIAINYTKQIEFVYKQFVILVQTDKAIYKPGQDVQFRVVILDDLLKPVPEDDINDIKIYIIDPRGIKLRDFQLNINTNDDHSYGVNKFNYNKGVTEDLAFNIHDEAMPGNWSLQVVIKGQVETYVFWVEYYTLPLANITISLPEFVEIANPILKYRIDAIYTFGKPVNGNLEMIIEKVEDCNRKFEPGSNKNFYKISKVIKGQFNQSLDLRDTSLIDSSCGEIRYNVTINVYDNYTKSVYTNYQEFSVLKTHIRANMNEIRPKYRPGHSIIQKVKLTSQTGELIPTKEIEDHITCEARIKTGASHEMSPVSITRIEKHDGLLICEIPTDFLSSQLAFSVILRNLTQELTLLNIVYDFESGCSQDYIQIEFQNEGKILNVGQSTSLVLRSNQPISEIILFTVIRGSIFKTIKIPFALAQKNQLFELNLTREMVPEAIVAVYMKSMSSNLIVSDSLKLSVEGIFHNQVKINVNTSLVDAGETAKFSVSAEKGSEIFLLAIDESVLALKQGNDLTNQRVLSDFMNNKAYKRESDGFLKAGMSISSTGPKECGTTYGKMIRDDSDDTDENKKGENRKVRKDFRETWIWDRTDLASDKTLVKLKDDVPDSITTWKITAFAIDDQHGLGLTTEPGYVTVFRPFFVKLNLPYSVKRHEETDVHLTIFNYLNETVKGEVNLNLNKTEDSKYVSFKSCQQKITIASNEIQTIICTVKSSEVGKFGLIAEVSGKGINSGKSVTPDAELREILVVYEGIQQSIQKNILFDLTDEDTNVLNINLPVLPLKNIVQGSAKMFLSATTDLLSITWQEKLKKIQTDIYFDFSDPSGCCQQRVDRYFPKVFWLDYLEMTDKITGPQYLAAVQEINFAINLICWHNPNDGSSVYYERFNDHGVSSYVEASLVPFVWQTAYSLKILNKAKKYTSVSQDQIFKTKNWLKSKCVTTGEYIESYQTPMFSTGTNAYLTSFVHYTLYETGETNAITNKWLETNFDKLIHPLDIMSTCYALHVVQSPKKEECYVKVEHIMKTDSTGSYWMDAKNVPDLHLTSYGLMILAKRNAYSKGLEVFKYVLSHQNSNPNVENVLDTWTANSFITSITTEALTKFYGLIKKYDPAIENIFINFNIDGTKNEIHLRPKTDITEVIEGNVSAKNIEVIARGFGRAKVLVQYIFNVNNFTDGHFKTNVTMKNQNENYILLTICTSHKESQAINNTIVEIDLPTGYTYHQEKFVTNSTNINKIEAENAGTHINVYLAKTHTDNFCFEIPAIENFKVRNRQPVPIKVYPYYDRSKLSVTTYS